MNKLTMIGGSGVLGLCLGLVLNGNGVNGQSLALAGLLALPPVAVGLVVADTRAQQQINQAESKASTALRSLDDISVKLATTEQSEARLKQELVEVLQQLGRSNELLKSCQFDCSQSVASINRLESSLAVATERLGELEAEVNEWEREFHTRVSSEAQKHYEEAKKREIQRIESENDAITHEALDIVRGFRQWAVEVDNRLQDAIARELRIHKITSVRKLEIADLIVVTFRREAAVKEDTIKLIAGTPEQFLEYVVNHPIRYRLIADPGTGKTPITAVMVSEILKVGGTRGNTGKGRKIPHTLVTVSCPDVESSQKDADYPLEIFLKYGNTTAAVKSFTAADEDWQYRKHDTNYANEFFQLWVWDELDNTLNNADDPKAVGEKFKNFLKQAHHTGVGWIVSGQSVMTKQIPGFMDDDRELFTQVIIGTSKIRKYLEKYGKKIISAKVVNQLFSNLDDLEPYIEDKNSLVTDAARLLRLALVLDDKSPKLYFLPNLDSAKFNAQKIEETTNKAQLVKRSFLAGTAGSGLASNGANSHSVSTDLKMTVPSNPTIGGDSQSSQKPHCPHCGSDFLNLLNDGRYRCLDCKKRFVTSKIVWR